MNISEETYEYVQALVPHDIVQFDQRRLNQHIDETHQIFSNILAQTKERPHQNMNEIISELRARIQNIAYKSGHPNAANVIRLYQNTFSKYFQISSPKISKFFANECFQNLNQYWEQGKSQQNQTKDKYKYLGQKVYNKIQQLFSQKNKISSIQRLFLGYPDLFLKIQQYEDLLNDSLQTNISSQLTNFLAITAASEFGSEYLLTESISKFLNSNGNIQWLKGNYPSYINPILKLNHYLSHCPWKIQEELVKQLSFKWSYSQILHISSILSYYQFLSIISCCMGLIPQNQGNLNLNTFFNLEDLNSFTLKSHQEKLQSKKLLKQSLSKSLLDVVNNQFLYDGRRSQKSEQTVDSDEDFPSFIPYMLKIDKQLSSHKKYGLIRQTFKNTLTSCKGLIRRDENEFQSQYESDWTLIDNCYPMMARFSPKISEKLIKLISQIKDYGFFQDQLKKKSLPSIKKTHSLNLEDKNIVSEQFINKVYCHKFRKSLLYYSDTFLGFIHEGYDYNNKMKTMLTFEQRFFIMMITIYPFLADQDLMVKYFQQSKGNPFMTINPLMSSCAKFGAQFSQKKKIDQKQKADQLFLLVLLIANNKQQRALSYLLKFMDRRQDPDFFE